MVSRKTYFYFYFNSVYGFLNEVLPVGIQYDMTELAKKHNVDLSKLESAAIDGFRNDVGKLRALRQVPTASIGRRGREDRFPSLSSMPPFTNITGFTNGQCLCGFRRSDGGAATGRQGTAWISTDFDNWMKESVDSFWLAEPHDPTQRGTYFAYDQVHLGTAPIVYDNVAVGLYGLWHYQQNPFKETSCDFGLLISNTD